MSSRTSAERWIPIVQYMSRAKTNVVILLRQQCKNIQLIDAYRTCSLCVRGAMEGCAQRSRSSCSGYSRACRMSNILIALPVIIIQSTNGSSTLAS